MKTLGVVARVGPLVMIAPVLLILLALSSSNDARLLGLSWPHVVGAAVVTLAVLAALRVTREQF
jgi:hypothetical protein